jgi:hypothetical protein
MNYYFRHINSRWKKENPSPRWFRRVAEEPARKFQMTKPRGQTNVKIQSPNKVQMTKSKLQIKAKGQTKAK